MLPSGSVTWIASAARTGTRSVHGEDMRRKWPVVPVSRMDDGEDENAVMERGLGDLGRQEVLGGLTVFMELL
jgi:hypothetical protein